MDKFKTASWTPSIFLVPRFTRGKHLIKNNLNVTQNFSCHF